MTEIYYADSYAWFNDLGLWFLKGKLQEAAACNIIHIAVEPSTKLQCAPEEELTDIGPLVTSYPKVATQTCWSHDEHIRKAYPGHIWG